MFNKECTQKEKIEEKHHYHISIWEVMGILREWCDECKVDIKRVLFKLDTCTDEDVDIIKIYTDRPGLLIGKAGCMIYKYKKKMLDLNDKYNVEIQLEEVHRVWTKQEEDIYFDSLIMGMGF